MQSLPTRLKMMQSSGTGRNGLLIAAALLALTVAGCQSSTTTALSTVDKAQGSSENISSLTSVIQSNPRDPEGYNVRGSAYGKSGRYKGSAARF